MFSDNEGFAFWGWGLLGSEGSMGFSGVLAYTLVLFYRVWLTVSESSLGPHYPREKKGSFFPRYKESHTPKSKQDP